jgi:hypothetical protein
MTSLLASPWIAALIGVAVAVVALLVGLAQSPADTLGLVAFLGRIVHVMAAVLWLGMIWFVNFVQLTALSSADDHGRASIMRHIVPEVAGTIRWASHAVLASGVVLLATSGYVLDRWVFPSAVYIPSMRGAMLWGAVLGGVVMWALVHLVIRPSVETLLAESGQAAASGGGQPSTNVVAARERVALAARINLVLSIPVTVAMIAAGHLF